MTCLPDSSLAIAQRPLGEYSIELTTVGDHMTWKKGMSKDNDGHSRRRNFSRTWKAAGPPLKSTIFKLSGQYLSPALDIIDGRASSTIR